MRPCSSPRHQTDGPRRGGHVSTHPWVELVRVEALLGDAVHVDVDVRRLVAVADDLVVRERQVRGV